MFCSTRWPHGSFFTKLLSAYFLVVGTLLRLRCPGESGEGHETPDGTVASPRPTSSTSVNTNLMTPNERLELAEKNYQARKVSVYEKPQRTVTYRVNGRGRPFTRAVKHNNRVLPCNAPSCSSKDAPRKVGSVGRNKCRAMTYHNRSLYGRKCCPSGNTLNCEINMPAGKNTHHVRALSYIF